MLRKHGFAPEAIVKDKPPLLWCLSSGSSEFQRGISRVIARIQHMSNVSGQHRASADAR